MKTAGLDRSLRPLRGASQGGCAQTGPSDCGGYFQDMLADGLESKHLPAFGDIDLGETLSIQ